MEVEPNTRVQLREARGRVHRLSLARDTARPRDGLTLWPLLTRGSVEERGRVYDRMIQIAPPPPAATRDAILRGDRAALDQWWDSLGVRSTTWWRLWKKKG